MKITRSCINNQVYYWTTVCGIDVCITQTKSGWYANDEMEIVNMKGDSYEQIIQKLKDFRKLMLNDGLEY